MKCMAGSLPAQILRRLSVKLVVNEWEQLVKGILVPFPPIVKKFRDITPVVGQPVVVHWSWEKRNIPHYNLKRAIFETVSREMSLSLVSEIPRSEIPHFL